MEVLKSIGGGINTGLDYVAQAKIARQMQEKLGPDWENILAHQASQREHEAAMRPGELEQQEATLAGTEASTAGTEASTAGALGRESREVELQPGEVEKQQLDIEGAGIGNELAQGTLNFQPTAQDIQRQQAVLSAAGAGVGTTPEGGLVPADVDVRVAQQQKAAETRDQYMQSLIVQAFANAQRKGYDITFSQVARIAEDILSPTGIQMKRPDMTDEELIKKINERIEVLQAVRQQGEGEGV
jgi:hypothetical protein